MATNYERIKNMSVKEMAEFIGNIETDSMPYCEFEHPFMCEKSCLCDDCREKWLKSEAKYE